MMTIAAKEFLANLQEGDEITFLYLNHRKNSPLRAGFVMDYPTNGTIRIWDYSLKTGPNFRTYNFQHIKHLAKLVKVSREEEVYVRTQHAVSTGMDHLQAYRDAIRQYTENLVNKGKR